MTFFKKFPNCLKRPKNVVWQSADGRVTSTTVAWPLSDFFSKFSQIAWNVQKTLFDSRPTVAWLRPLSRDRSATFFKILPNCSKRPKTLFNSQSTVAWPPTTVAWPFSDFFSKFSQIALKRPRNVVWQSSDGRVTSDHCRVTVQRLFSKTFIIAWNVQKTLFDSRPTVAWPPTTVAWPFSDFFKILPNCLKRPKTLFDSRPTVAWPPTTVAWPFSDFFQNFPKSLETSKKRCLTVGRRSRDLRPLSRDRLATLKKKNSNCLKRRKIVCLTVSRQSRDLRPLSRDRSATFFKIFANR